MENMINEYADKLPKKILNDLKDYLGKRGKVSESKLKKILDTTVEEYNNARVHPGESVGIISAESIG